MGPEREQMGPEREQQHSTIVEVTKPWDNKLIA
jgi:hypothetical protein